MNMINHLQRKLVENNYISNSLFDRSARYEIHIFLKECLKNNSVENVCASVEKFIDHWINRTGAEIKNKSAYFKKLVNDNLNELDVPDIMFVYKKPNKKEIMQTIFDIITIATTPDGKYEYEACNPLDSDEWATNRLYGVSDDLYNKAFSIIKSNKDYYLPIISRLLELNNIPNEGPSIKTDLDQIYEQIEKGATKHVQ